MLRRAARSIETHPNYCSASRAFRNAACCLRLLTAGEAIPNSAVKVQRWHRLVGFDVRKKDLVSPTFCEAEHSLLVDEPWPHQNSKFDLQKAAPRACEKDSFKRPRTPCLVTPTTNLRQTLHSPAIHERRYPSRRYRRLTTCRY